jgi:hypothetical protein
MNQLATPPSPLKAFDVQDVLEKLSTKEKISLLSGISHHGRIYV